MDTSELNARLNALPAHQRALLEQRLRERQGPATCETSVTQQGLWLVDQIATKDRVYTLGWRIGLTGCLDTGAMASAVNAVVARHAALRTTFAVEDGRPVQVVRPQLRISVPVDDLSEAADDRDPSAAADDVVEAAVAAVCAAEIATPFDLAEGPLVRARLLRLSDDRHVLVLLVHHIVFDALSLDIALQDIADAYNALCAGRALPDTPPPAQYPDFARWQRRHLTDARLDRLIGYWRQQLAGASELLTLPTARPRPAEQTHAGAEYRAVLPAELAERLGKFALTERTTLFTVLLAAFQVLLMRYSGQSDINVGTTVGGRVRSEFETAIGFFINTLVLHADLSDDPGFREHLRRTRGTFLAAYDHQALPFDRLVEELRPQRSLSHNPLFQVLFESHGEGGTEQRVPEFAGLREVTVEGIDVGRSKVDLNLSAVEKASGIELTVEYATDLFDAQAVAQLTAHYQRLLEVVLDHPDLPVGALDILLPAERQLLDAPGTPTPSPAEPACLHDLVRRHAVHAPHRVAVSRGGQSVSYGELDRSSSRLAHHLIARRVGPETVVAVVLPRSPEQVTAVLAVLRTGAVCLPADPAAPAERLRRVLSDARPTVVLTDRATADRLSGTDGLLPVDVLSVDDENHAATVDGHPSTPPQDADRTAPVLPAHPAFLLYAATSSGRFAGVPLTHENLAGAIAHTAAALTVSPGSRIPHHAAVGSDLDVLETLTALASGAELVLDPAGRNGDTAPAGHATTHLLVTGADLAGPPPAASGAHVLVLADEPLPAREADRWAADRQLTFAYGHTETAVLTMSAGPGRPAIRPPFARRAAGARVHVLDARLRPVPPGVNGELYVAGSGVARGYHRLPALTAERFLPDPYGPPGSRMFRTGDLGRWDEHGRLVVLGRADHRILVRGLPVEPGAVEQTLLEHPGVARAAVSVHSDGNGDGPNLVAHVVPTAGSTLDAQALRHHLGALLAAPRVPAAVTVTRELLTAPNGRLDRAALSAPRRDRPSGRAPRSAREAVLRELFADVLGLPTVGLDDDFFDLGGHSMLAFRLIAEVQAVLGAEMGLRLLFEAPTVAKLAAALDHADGRTDAAHSDLDVLLPLRTTGEKAPVFCVHPAMGLGWSFAGLVRHLDPRQPVYALQSPGLVAGPHAVPTTVEETADVYLEHVRQVARHGPYHFVGWSAGGLIAHAMAVRLQEQGETVGLLAVLDGYPLSGRGHVPPSLQEEQDDIRRETADLEVDDTLRTRIAEVYTAVSHAAWHHSPGVFHGDLLHVRAAHRRDGGAFTPDLWLPHVVGRLLRQSLTCDHEEMTRPDALAEIGPRLAMQLGS